MFTPRCVHTSIKNICASPDGAERPVLSDAQPGLVSFSWLQKIAATADCPTSSSVEMIRCLKGKTENEILQTTLKMVNVLQSDAALCLDREIKVLIEVKESQSGTRDVVNNNNNGTIIFTPPIPVPSLHEN